MEAIYLGSIIQGQIYGWHLIMSIIWGVIIREAIVQGAIIRGAIVLFPWDSVIDEGDEYFYEEISSLFS